MYKIAWAIMAAGFAISSAILFSNSDHKDVADTLGAVFGVFAFVSLLTVNFTQKD